MSGAQQAPAWPPAGTPEIARASGSFVTTADGRTLLDLANGFGAVFMGHGHPRIVAHVHRQVDAVWAAARGASTALARAEAAVRDVLPEGLRPAGFYSTGMEVVEYAMRLAATLTGRTGFVGFDRSMHGKSALTASLCWPNAPIALPGHGVRLPFAPEAGDDALVASVAEALSARSVAALLVEPIQASNGGRAAPDGVLERILRLCRASGTLCIFDEIMTGLWRTGPRFCVDRLETRPDMLLFGKSMANGLPVAALAVRDGLPLPAAALPGSTFAGNPVAMAAAEATLGVMEPAAMQAGVERIGHCVREAFAGRCPGWRLRGRGALWVLERDGDAAVGELLSRIVARGVLVSGVGRCVRLLPAATIDVAALRDGCRAVADVCEAAPG